MSKKKIESHMLTEHILEIRYVASGSFLDARGYIADYIRGSGLFPHWNIDANVVNFFDAESGKVEKIGAFAGYKNAGCTIKNPDTKNFFQDKAISYWETLIANKVFKLPDLTRFGARTTTFITSTKSFEEINNEMYTRFFTSEGRNILGGAETDLMYTIELNEEQFRVRVTIGPLHEGEAEKFFSFKTDQFNSAGLFVDVDCYKTDGLTQKTVPKLLRNAMALTWAKVEKITDSLKI